MDFKRYRKLERKGIIIDSIMAMVINTGILLSIFWLLMITGNSLYILMVGIFTGIILTAVFGLIEINYCPIIVRYIYQAEFRKEEEEIKAFEKSSPFLPI